MSGTFKLLTPPGSRSRIRLSHTILAALGWEALEADFQCYGWFRSRDELLCVPVDHENENGEHPFADVIAIVGAISRPNPGISLRDIPKIRDFVAADRLITFGASWTSKHAQLDLNVGVDVTGRLGWVAPPGDIHPIYARAYAGILIAISEQRYCVAEEENLSPPSSGVRI
jgi:hypothetical protein